MKEYNDYISAITSETPRIMGIDLRPFSIGSYLLLKKFECGFVSDEPTQITINDLIIAISICARKFDQFLEFIKDPKCLKWIKKWGKTVNKDIGKNPSYFVEKELMFRKYLIDGMRFPKYWLLVESDNPSNSGKFLEHMISTLQSKLGYTRDEVLNIPFTQAIYDYFLYLEQNGVIQLMNDNDLELLETSEKNNLETSEVQSGS